MEDLRLAIIVLGVFSILGILVHGLWTIRKNAANKETANPHLSSHNRKEPALDSEEAWQETVGDTDEVISIPDDDPLLDASISNIETEDKVLASVRESESTAESQSFDEDGIGQVRTVVRDPIEPKPSAKKEEPKTTSPTSDDESFPEPPSSLLKEAESKKPEAKPDSSKSKPSLAERAKQLVNGDKKAPKSGKRVEPKLQGVREDQIRMDFEEQQIDVEQPSNEPVESEPVQQEVLVLNVKVPDGKEISGASLLPALLTLGFKFGEQDVFHRHAASNGKGPKLFSLANMFKPGTFNLDEMETFTTQGVSLFMILPIEGDPQQVFNMMHNAARKLADEFGAQILDGRRSLLTKQSLRQYVEKIREFERKRMIHKA